MTVAEVMQTEPVTLREADSLATAAETLIRTRHHGLPVVNQDGDLVGIFTAQDLDRAQSDENTSPTVGEVCTRDLLVALPDETLASALRRMSGRDIGRLPVVAREEPRRLVGMLRRTDLVRAYDIALTRRAALRHRAQQVRLGAFSGVSIEEIPIEPGAPCAGRRVSEVKWPRDCVIATLRRGRQVILPRGNTVLNAGDVLVFAVEGTARETIRQLCQAEIAPATGTPR